MEINTSQIKTSVNIIINKLWNSLIFLHGLRIIDITLKKLGLVNQNREECLIESNCKAER